MPCAAPRSRDPAAVCGPVRRLAAPRRRSIVVPNGTAAAMIEGARGAGTGALDEAHPAVAVLDRSAVRLAALTSLLEPWADENELDLRPFDLDALERTIPPSAPREEIRAYRLIVIAIGQRTMTSDLARGWLLRARARFPGAAPVLFSDRKDGRGVRRAFELGARGYIPANLPPRLALSALTLVLRGGFYVPPLAFRPFRDGIR